MKIFLNDSGWRNTGWAKKELLLEIRVIGCCCLTGTDPEPALRDAFAMFDTEGKGKLYEE